MVAAVIYDEFKSAGSLIGTNATVRTNVSYAQWSNASSSGFIPGILMRSPDGGLIRMPDAGQTTVALLQMDGSSPLHSTAGGGVTVAEANMQPGGTLRVALEFEEVALSVRCNANGSWTIFNNSTNVTGTTAAPSGSVTYRIEITTTAVRFYINGTLVYTRGTGVPAGYCVFYVQMAYFDVAGTPGYAAGSTQLAFGYLHLKTEVASGPLGGLGLGSGPTLTPVTLIDDRVTSAGAVALRGSIAPGAAGAIWDALCPGGGAFLLPGQRTIGGLVMGQSGATWERAELTFTSNAVTVAAPTAASGFGARKGPGSTCFQFTFFGIPTELLIETNGVGSFSLFSGDYTSLGITGVLPPGENGDWTPPVVKVIGAFGSGGTVGVPLDWPFGGFIGRTVLGVEYFADGVKVYVDGVLRYTANVTIPDTLIFTAIKIRGIGGRLTNRASTRWTDHVFMAREQEAGVFPAVPVELVDPAQLGKVNKATLRLSRVWVTEKNIRSFVVPRGTRIDLTDIEYYDHPRNTNTLDITFELTTATGRRFLHSMYFRNRSEFSMTIPERLSRQWVIDLANSADSTAWQTDTLPLDELEDSDLTGPFGTWAWATPITKLGISITLMSLWSEGPGDKVLAYIGTQLTVKTPSAPDVITYLPFCRALAIELADALTADDLLETPVVSPDAPDTSNPNATADANARLANGLPLNPYRLFWTAFNKTYEVP